MLTLLQEAMQRRNFAAKAAARALEEANANECIIRCLRLKHRNFVNQYYLDFQLVFDAVPLVNISVNSRSFLLPLKLGIRCWSSASSW